MTNSIYVATFYWDLSTEGLPYKFNQEQTRYFRSKKSAENYLVYMFRKHQNEMYLKELKKFEDCRSDIPESAMGDYIERYNDYRDRYGSMINRWSQKSYYDIEQHVFIPSRESRDCPQPYRFAVSLKSEGLS
jgi:hypothetical protein